jgi:hypothetical protein
MCGHKLLSIIFLPQQVRNQILLSTRDPASPVALATWLRPHKAAAGKAVHLLYSLCDPTENRTLINGLKTRCPNR